MNVSIIMTPNLCLVSMTEDHTFIDREGNATSSKEKMRESWVKFFEMFPEYKNIFTKLESKDNFVVIIGYAFWSDENPHDSVIWTTEIEDDLVVKWCIYEDTAENRERFGISNGIL